MQQYKIIMRQVGVPDADNGVIRADEFTDEVEYEWAAKGYELFESHYLGEVRRGADIIGYKLLWILVKGGVAARQTLKSREETLARE